MIPDIELINQAIKLHNWSGRYGTPDEDRCRVIRLPGKVFVEMPRKERNCAPVYLTANGRKLKKCRVPIPKALRQALDNDQG